MKCPYCGAEMKAGAIQSARLIYFTERPHSFWFLPDPGEIRLTGHNWTKPTCMAFHCPACKKIVIDYTEPENP